MTGLHLLPRYFQGTFRVLSNKRTVDSALNAIRLRRSLSFNPGPQCRNPDARHGVSYWAANGWQGSFFRGAGRRYAVVFFHSTDQAVQLSILPFPLSHEIKVQYPHRLLRGSVAAHPQTTSPPGCPSIPPGLTSHVKQPTAPRRS